MKTILVALDFSDSTAPIMDAACRIGRLDGSELILLHVMEPIAQMLGYDAGGVAGSDVAATEQSCMTQLEQLKSDVESKGLKARVIESSGLPANVILEQAAEHEANMVIMGSHGHGSLFHLLVGSVTEDVLKRINIPVMIVPLRQQNTKNT